MVCMGDSCDKKFRGRKVLGMFFLKDIYVLCLLLDIETFALRFLSLFHKEGVAFLIYKESL